jgi:hypothetical protein
MTPRIKGVLAGGIVGGLLSAIPFVNWGNCLCCLWVILAGTIASTVHVKSSTEGVSKTDGTITGLISAVPMVALYVIVGLPLNLLLGPAMIGVIASLTNDPMIQQQMMQQVGQSTIQTVLNFAVGTLVFAVFAAGFGSLGGLIGTAIFEDREPEDPGLGPGAPLAPPPPQQPPYQPYQPPPQGPQGPGQAGY